MARRQNLKDGKLNTEADLQRRRGRVGGAATSEAKATAARANGAKGGRPKKGSAR